MEYLDVLDENGNKTGEIIERNEAHRRGVCHRVIQVWIINSDNELLIQKRSKNKAICPDLWFISLGAHIVSNESNEETIKREFAEELGLDVEIEEVKYLYTSKEIATYKNGTVIDNEVYDVYLIKMDLDPKKLKLQEDEVQEVKFISYNDFKLSIQNKDPSFWINKEEFSLFFSCLDRYLNSANK